MDPEIIELPLSCDGAADDQWRVEFWHDGKLYWLNDVPRAWAENILRAWREGSSDRLTSCGICPDGMGVSCPHSDTAEQRDWVYAEMTSVRIMPMREAL